MVYNGKRFWNNSSQQSNNNSAQNATGRVSDPALKTRLEKLISSPDVQNNASSLQFMKSLLEQFTKYHSLSEKQAKCIADAESRYVPSSASSKAFDEWKEEYDEQKRDNAIKIAKWYKNNHEQSPNTVPYYYQFTAEKILSDESYIPSRESYDKMVGNKFAEKYLENTAKGSRFTAGDLAELSGIKKAIQLYRNKFPCETGLVIHVAEPRKAIAGGYIITVMPTGTDVMIEVEERWLRKVKI